MRLSIMQSKLLVLLFLLICNQTYAQEKTEVVVIAALHGMHKDHPGYDYDDLYELVDSYNPGFVGVEIRPEDIQQDEKYLRKNYPREMVDLTIKYQEQAFGFDWLGESIKGVPIPELYWNDLKVIQLQKELGQNNELQNIKPKEIERINQRQQEIIKMATPSSINNGEYGKLCREIDALEAAWLNNTKFKEIIDFNRRRDAEIGNNIIDFIKTHKGSRIVLIMGADHRTYAIENINQYFGEEVVVLKID